MQNIVPLLIPIIISLGAFIMVLGLRYMNNKENMAMIEKGMEPRRQQRREVNHSQTLKNGLIFIGAGLGLLLAIIITSMFNLEGDKGTGIYFALIAIFGGMGMLSAYVYERKNPPADTM